jgi:Helix-hairpin-helix motif
MIKYIPAKFPFTNISARFAVKLIIALITTLLINCDSWGQNKNLSEIIPDIAEQLAEDEPDPSAAELFVERLQELSEKPVKINTAEESEISRLCFLSDFQVKAIIDHIKKSGNIVSVYELASIPGFDRQTVEMMIPFVSLTPEENDPPGKFKIRSSLITNMITKPGDIDTSLLGSSLKILSKYRTNAGPFSAGIMIEKDPGETFLSGSPPIPDFFSSHLCWSGKGFVRKILLGDYSARFGQGTNINTYMRTSLTLTASGYMSGHDEIKPYTSSDENNFLRGAAAVFSIKNLDLSLFCSRNKLDATVNPLPDSAKMYVSSFYKSGLHNTESLMLKKDAVSETLFGFNINCNFSSIRLGVTWSESRFSIPLNLKGGGPEGIKGFEGTKNGICSVYYNSLIRRILFYGEFSSDYSYKIAMVEGVTLRPSDRLSINFLYRNYLPGFTSLHGRGPGNGSSTGNECGILGNFTFEAARNFFISAGCDIAWFPWLKYNTSYPSMSRKQEIRFKYNPGENLIIEASYNYRFSMTDLNNEQGTPGIKELTSRTLKGIIRYSHAGRTTLTIRADYKVADEISSKGMLLLQDISHRFRRLPLTIWLRYSIFNTDDWYSRIYAYENDLLYSFSIPALAGRGSRTYLMAEWEIGDYAELRIKYGITSHIAEGYSTEETDELKVQFRIWF